MFVLPSSLLRASISPLERGGIMDPIRFAILGGGYRTQAYLQIARELPDRFQVDSMFVRNAAKGQALEARWNVKTYRTLEELLHSSKPHFVVVSLPRSVTALTLREP